MPRMNTNEHELSATYGRFVAALLLESGRGAVGDAVVGAAAAGALTVVTGAGLEPEPPGALLIPNCG
jgi:hypothetical protein